MLARDVVVSIRRFAARISFAKALMAATEELSAPDDRTVRFRLKRYLLEGRAGEKRTVRRAHRNPIKRIDARRAEPS